MDAPPRAASAGTRANPTGRVRAMKLSAVTKRPTLPVVRDADFDDLSLLGAIDGRVLVYAGDARSLERLARTTAAAAVVTTAELADEVPPSLGLATADHPAAAFYDLHRWLHSSSDFYWRDFPSTIDPSARVHERAFIAPRSVRIGARAVVEPNATVLERVTIGDDAIVRAGAVLGSEGFEFKGPAMRQGRTARRIGRDRCAGRDPGELDRGPQPVPPRHAHR